MFIAVVSVCGGWKVRPKHFTLPAPKPVHRPISVALEEHAAQSFLIEIRIFLKKKASVAVPFIKLGREIHPRYYKRLSRTYLERNRKQQGRTLPAKETRAPRAPRVKRHLK
jgi:hypothetical protein